MSDYEQYYEEAKQQTGENVAIFIDYDNIFHSFRDFGVNIESEEADVINFLWNCYTRDKVRMFKAYADFDQVDVQLRNLQINRVQIKRVYGNGKGEKFRKNASDIELSIDAVESAYNNPNIDTYVFVTADSDMIPVMSRMIFKGKKVHLYYLSTNVSQYQDITKYSHYNKDLLSIFNIDSQRQDPSYWVDIVTKHISDWYNESKNKNNMYGGSWLRDGLINCFSMSKDLASTVIEYLEKEGLIIKFRVSSNNREGYILSAELATFETKYGENALTQKPKTPIA